MKNLKIRSKISGTKSCPRLSVFRSNKHIYGQLIDDKMGKTMAAASEHNLSGLTKLGKTEKARRVGKILAEKALKKGIAKVVFDRGGYKYHGRIKALADICREEGLKF